MEMKPYIVYVKTNSDGYITAVNSSAFLEDVTGWTEIDGGYGDKYHHAQGNYFPKPIKAISGAYCYKLVDGKVEECTAEEIAEHETTITNHVEPTQLDIIEAQVTYTAMMTDTLLEV
jgi:hypothetical protein